MTTKAMTFALYGTLTFAYKLARAYCGLVLWAFRPVALIAVVAWVCGLPAERFALLFGAMWLGHEVLLKLLDHGWLKLRIAVARRHRNNPALA